MKPLVIALCAMLACAVILTVVVEMSARRTDALHAVITEQSKRIDALEAKLIPQKKATKK